MKPKRIQMPNYSQYEYANVLPPFRELDRVNENDISTLVCYDSHKLELSLNDLTDNTLADYLYMLFCKKGLMTAGLIRKLVVFFVRRYQNQILPWVQTYLDSKKLTLDEWLNAVKKQCQGDIVCLYLLNIITGQHTCIHLKDGQMWSTLRRVPINHDEHVAMCDLHLVYLGFGAFIKLIPVQPRDIKGFVIIGTITADDQATRDQLGLMAKNQEEVRLSCPPSRPTATAGSASQLTRVECEMSAMSSKPITPSSSNIVTSGTVPSVISSPTPSMSTKPCCTPGVLQRPFQVLVKKLTTAEIAHYTNRQSSEKKPPPPPPVIPCSVHLQKLLPRDIQDYQTVQAKLRSRVKKIHQPRETADTSQTERPTATKAPTVAALPKHRHVFAVKKHILKKCHTKMYLKCRVRGCVMAYVTFNTVHSMTSHHCLHHQNITYPCSNCDKKLPTPNSLRLHQYIHQAKTHKCNVCNDSFVYLSSLKQQQRKHCKQKVYECFHGTCNKKYKYPQDLRRHVQSHFTASHECDFCDKCFKEKRLLKHHLAVHQKTPAYKCKTCGEGFRHNNQLYWHRRKAHN